MMMMMMMMMIMTYKYVCLKKTRKEKKLTKNKEFSLPLSPNAVFVSLIHLISFVVVFAVGEAATIGDRYAFAGLVPDFSIGARATLRAHGLARVISTQGNGTTRRLTIVHACLENLT